MRHAVRRLSCCYRPRSSTPQNRSTGGTPLEVPSLGPRQVLVAGVVIMMRNDEYLGPPAYIYTAPVGGVVGFLGGLVVGALARP